MRHMYKIPAVLLCCLSLAVQAQQSPSLSGTVTDQAGHPLPGAGISIGRKAQAVTDESGRFYVSGTRSGTDTLQVSLVGYTTVHEPLVFKNGQPRQVQIRLQEAVLQLEGLIVTAQKRAQQARDVPAAVTVLDGKFLQRNNIRDLDVLSGYVPGLNIQVQSTNRPGFVIRGLTSDDAGAGSQSRVSVYFNNVPSSRPIGSVFEVYDMAGVEVLKGPQGTLFGKGALAGAVHFIPQRPVARREGMLSAGFGNYGQQVYTAVINTPLYKDKLLIRAAGTFNHRNGYVENTFGGTLNGKHTLAGRLSLSYQPGSRTSIDYVANYQEDQAPGTAFISKTYPNQQGVIDPFAFVASLDQGKALSAEKTIQDHILTIRHQFNPQLALTAISAYRNNTGLEHFDGDGAAAKALDVIQDTHARQFYQELRLNVKAGERFNGFGGVSYWAEKVHDVYDVTPDERSFVWLRLDKNKMIDPKGNPVLLERMPTDPKYGPAADKLLPVDHREQSVSDARNSSLEVFADGTYKLTSRFEVSGGLRAVRDMLELQNAVYTSGSPSIVGYMTKNQPGLIYKPRNPVKHSTNYTTILGRIVFKYALTPTLNIYGGYSKGRRAKLIQFNPDNSATVLAPEILNSYDLGIKGDIGPRFNFDLGVFYSRYNNFQTRTYMADTAAGQFLLVMRDGGKARSYGAELAVRYAAMRHLQLYGNYAWLHARFDDYDNNGNKQQLAGNHFRLTPDHSFTLGAELSGPLGQRLSGFFRPSYTYRSHMFFEDTNNPGIEQGGYGIANVRLGVAVLKYRLEWSCYMNNIFNQHYLMDAGNSGQTFNIPTFVPGAPRMFGVEVTWRF